MKKYILTCLFSLISISVFCQLYVKNGTNTPVWVAIARWKVDLLTDFEGWVSKGWYQVQPGGTVETLTAFQMYNDTYYYFAMNAEGILWEGQAGFLVNVTDAFEIDYADKAYVKNQNYQFDWRNFRELYVGDYTNFTLTLTNDSNNNNVANRCLSGDCMNGYGTYQWGNGMKLYTGYFRNGKRNGQGTCTYGAGHQWNGASYQGEWLNDKYNGEGTFTWADGSKYVGAYKNEKKHGYGTLYSKYGTIQSQGMWENDVFVGKREQPKPKLTWLNPRYSAETDKNYYRIKACVKSRQNIDSYEVYVNGQLADQERAPEVVRKDDCDLLIERTLSLKTGANRVEVKVRATNGESASISTTITRKGNAVIEEDDPITPVHTGKKLALLIGNSNYQNTTALRNPGNDVNALQKELKRLGFDVIANKDQSRSQMAKSINEFGRKLKNYDQALFYFSGHGVQVKGANYLIPTNATLDYEEDVEFQCINAGSILAKMEGAQSKVNIVILDACRNNPFEKSWNRNINNKGLTTMTAPVGTILAYSTAPGTTASDGIGNNGLYTEKLLECLRIPNLKIEEVFKQVRIRVTQASNNKQVPWESSSLVGDVILNRRK